MRKVAIALVLSFFSIMILEACSQSGHGSQAWHPPTPGGQMKKRK